MVWRNLLLYKHKYMRKDTEQMNFTSMKKCIRVIFTPFCLGSTVLNHHRPFSKEDIWIQGETTISHHIIKCTVHIFSTSLSINLTDWVSHCTVVSSSSVSGTLTLHSDSFIFWCAAQIFTKPRCWPDLGLVKVWLRSELDNKR